MPEGCRNTWVGPAAVSVPKTPDAANRRTPPDRSVLYELRILVNNLNTLARLPIQELARMHLTDPP